MILSFNLKLDMTVYLFSSNSANPPSTEAHLSIVCSGRDSQDGGGGGRYLGNG